MNKRNIFWGIFFILAAIFIFLNQVGFFVEISLFKLIITLLLIPVIFKSAVHGHFGGVLFPLAIIGILYDSALGIEFLTPWPLLGIALFLSIGLSFIFPKHNFDNVCEVGDERYLESMTEESENTVNIKTQFTGGIKYITSNALEAVNVKTSFAGTKIYFDNATIASKSAQINIDASFSGIELYIPKTWKIENSIDCMMGGVNEKGTKIQSESSKTLILTGYLKCAGVSIIYV